MRHIIIFINYILLIFFACGTHSSPKSHPITTLINAKWHLTPVSFEISEFLHDENPNLFWDYVEGVNALVTPSNKIETDSKKYIASMGVIRNLISPAQISLLKLSLSMHSLSPRIQAHFQIANEVLQHGDCRTTSFVAVGNELACSLSQVKTAIEHADPNLVEVYSFDHTYPGSENNSITAILYSEIGSEEFKEFHNYLKEQALRGRVEYIARHYLKHPLKQKTRLSGYGVELHLKSTEYKSQDDSPRQSDENNLDNTDVQETEVDGFNFDILRKRFPDLSHSLDRLRDSLLEKSEEIAPLKAWEFQELGLQAAHRVAQIQGEEALQILQLTAQNFPTQAKSLLHLAVPDDFKKEMKNNIEVFGRNLNLQPPDAALFVNGMFFDAETLDLGSLVETLRTETGVLDGLHKLSIKGKLAASLLALDLSASSSKEFAIDIRDTAIIWINDLENDSGYRRWPSSLMDLLRPTFPGMLRNIRKNLYNLVLVVDPLTTEGRGLIKLAESFIIHLVPIRVGIVFDSRKENEATKNDYRAIFCAFNYAVQNESPRSALGFLTDVFASVTDTKAVNFQDIKQQLKKSFNRITPDIIDDILSEDSDFDYGRQLSLEFIERLGCTSSLQVLLNGVPLQQTLLNPDDFEEAVLTEVMQQTPTFQKAVYKGDLADSDSAIDYLMNQPHVMPRLNQKILSTDEPKFLDLSGKPHNDLENLNALQKLSNRDTTATLLDNLKYFSNKHSLDKILGKSVHLMTLWIVTDLEKKQGRNLLEHALNYMKAAGGVRVAFIPNTEGSAISKTDNLNRLVWAATQSLQSDEATNVVLEWLRHAETKNFDIPSPVKELISSTELHLKMLRVYSQRVLNLKSSQSVVISNGRIFEPLDNDEIFTADDFSLIDRFSSYQYGDKIRKALEQNEEDEELNLNSDTILKLITTLVPRQQTRSRFAIPAELQENHTVVNLQPKTYDSPYFDIVAVLDPASRGAQKLSPILILLRNVINCNMKVFLCAVDKHSDMPVKNFYRFVIEPELQFTPDGKFGPGPSAKFVGLPASPLLTQNLQVPENWLVEIVRSVYDLDNIKLIEIGGPVHSEYELEYLLLEGHCFDSTTGAPPRGLQITLGTKEQPVIVDTIVMANLGYFQLKANPGVWELRLRQGKSADIYEVTSAEGPNTIHNVETTKIVISSLRSHVVKLRVTKKPDMTQADLLGDETDTQSGIWDSIANSFGGGSASNSDSPSDVINIFSVASGHLYERLLRIMMLSLIKHTKSPVKFWFLKNYLSPQFIDFLPHMSEEYGFQYELVQYKWPRWLHQQTEKQRTIWGYKILFLDVLFPLDVKKIIFVDADAIVRTDIKELDNLDLGNAPYAYTPFCDSRKEMEGFRFWKQGYWRNHLMGRRYHISALYVVDLKRFRKIAAGDRLRGQYQALSQDPNSLSNLDQDLPNNMIHQVAIKSLPQEWLWCQTWCGDDSFKKAKVIDLCNNPQTKEAKLTAAQRIVPEWKSYDQEIKNLMIKIEDHEMGDSATTITANVHDVDDVEGGGSAASDDKDEHNHSEL